MDSSRKMGLKATPEKKDQTKSTDSRVDVKTSPSKTDQTGPNYLRTGYTSNTSPEKKNETRPNYPKTSYTSNTSPEQKYETRPNYPKTSYTSNTSPEKIYQTRPSYSRTSYTSNTSPEHKYQTRPNYPKTYYNTSPEQNYQTRPSYSRTSYTSNTSPEQKYQTRPNYPKTYYNTSPEQNYQTRPSYSRTGYNTSPEKNYQTRPNYPKTGYNTSPEKNYQAKLYDPRIGIKTTPEKNDQTKPNYSRTGYNTSPEKNYQAKLYDPRIGTKTTPEKKDQTRPNYPRTGYNTSPEKNYQAKPDDSRISIKTTPEKKDQTNAYNPRSPQKKEQSRSYESNRLSFHTKTATQPRGSSATFEGNLVVQIPSTSRYPHPTYTYPSVPRPVLFNRPVSIMTTLSPNIPPIFTGYPYPTPRWPHTVQLPSPVYSLPILPVTLISPISPPRQVCPYSAVISNTRIPAAPFYGVPSMCPPTHPCHQYQRVFNYNQQSPENSPNQSPRKYEEIPEIHVKRFPKQDTSDPGSYLLLPKDLFPNARQIALDPNPMINELCLEDNIIDSHLPWILDIEFGIPRVPATRTIAIYDVQYNSIYSENTPGTIHPTFETCSQDFKRLLLFYYDCIISSWYKGYMTMNEDTSVANFQSWLETPMYRFGLCWP